MKTEMSALQIGTKFRVPSDNDEVIYTVTDAGIIGSDERGGSTQPIDPSEFEGVEIQIVG